MLRFKFAKVGARVARLWFAARAWVMVEIGAGFRLLTKKSPWYVWVCRTGHIGSTKVRIIRVNIRLVQRIISGRCIVGRRVCMRKPRVTRVWRRSSIQTRGLILFFEKRQQHCVLFTWHTGSCFIVRYTAVAIEFINVWWRSVFTVPHISRILLSSRHFLNVKVCSDSDNLVYLAPGNRTMKNIFDNFYRFQLFTLWAEQDSGIDWRFNEQLARSN